MTRHRAVLRSVIVIFCLFVIKACCLAQSSNTGVDSLNNRIKSNLSNHFSRYPAEKTFLHINQSVYVSGQTIWYAAYCIAYGRPSVLSKVVYVQLINQSGQVIKSNRHPLESGAGHGNIDLPDSLLTGWYRLRCFTAWMMNFSSVDFFSKSIYILNTSQPQASKAITPKPAHYSIRFFPEGGEIADGATSTIAFKAIDTTGSPAAVHGEVLNQAKQVVARFNTMHNGMGTFELEGSKDTYIAKVHFTDHDEMVKLPASRPDAVGFRLSTNKHALEFKVSCTNQVAKIYPQCLLVAVQADGIYNTFPLELVAGTNVFNVQKDQFKTGVLRLTLFSKTGIPLAERLVFIDHGGMPPLQLKTDSVTFNETRSVVNIEYKGTGSSLLTGNVSVAVTDAESVPEDNLTDNIRSYYLLSSELKGNIYDPGWYFSGDSVKKEIDLVMLTNGWRRFKWTANDTPFTLKYPVESGIFIAGKIKNFNKTQFEQDQIPVTILLLNEDKSRYMGAVTPDSTGSFILKGYPFYGTSRIYLEAASNKKHQQAYHFQLLNSLTDSLPKLSAVTDILKWEAEPSTDILTALARNRGVSHIPVEGVLLKTVNIKAQKVDPLDQLIRSHVHSKYETTNAYTLDLVNYQVADVGIIQYIKGRFPGLQVTDYPDNTVVFLYHGQNTLQDPPGPPTLGFVHPASSFYPYFYIDEMQVTLDDIENIPMVNVALIRYMPPPVWFAPYNGGNIGALMIYTKRQSDDIKPLQGKEKYDQFFVNGYTITREFASPDDVAHPGFTVNKPTIYWSPNLQMKSGKVRLSFPNTDDIKKYRLVLQGFTTDGRLMYINKVIEK